MATKIEEKKLYEKRNRDDIFVRDVIGGLLKVLNNKLVYDQIWDDTKEGIESITIPFYYEIGNVTGERFLQDNYVTFGSQCGFKKINGNFDMIPRGMISLASLQIESDSITNRMVMGEYQKEDPIDGKIKTYVAFLFAIPMKMTIDVEIRSSSFTEMLKIVQACNEFFYKNKTYYINHKGMKLGCRVGFPDSFLAEKNSGYTMGGQDVDKLNLKQTFQLEIECYQPVFDKSTERLKSNVIRAWGSSVETATSVKELNERDGYMTIRKEIKDDGFFQSAPYYFEYNIKIPSDGYEYYLQTGELLNPDKYQQQSMSFATSALNEYNNMGQNIKDVGDNPSDIYDGGMPTNQELINMFANQNSTYLSSSRKSKSNNFNLIYVIDDLKDWSLLPSDAVINIRWQYRKHNADIRHVLIQFKEKTGFSKDEHFKTMETETTTLALIENHLEFDWYIPKDFTGFSGTDLILINNDNVQVYREPKIKVVPDPRTMKITENSIFCLDPGYFICPYAQTEWDKKERNKYGAFSYYTHIEAELMVKSNDGKYKQMMITLPIKDNKIETIEGDSTKINFERVMDKKIDINYSGTIPYRVGDIVISDANNSNIYTTIENVHIV